MSEESGQGLGTWWEEVKSRSMSSGGGKKHKYTVKCTEYITGVNTEWRLGQQTERSYLDFFFPPLGYETPSTLHQISVDLIKFFIALASHPHCNGILCAPKRYFLKQVPGWKNLNMSH